MDLLKLANILVEKIKRDYQNDVSIVHIHGSYAYGNAHDRSDLDIYFVPKTPRGFNLGCTFILDGIGCDFWALSWDRLEHIANHGEKTASIITDGQVLYYGSDEDLERFDGLKRRALDISDRSAWFSRAKKALGDAYKDGFILQNAKTLSDVRTNAIGLIYNLSYTLAQLNQITVKRGRRLLKQEILDMPLVPNNFADLYDAIFLNNDMHTVKNACVELLLNTAELLDNADNDGRTKKEFSDLFGGWYEEMIQSYNKIYHACEVEDIYTPLFASVEFSYELGMMFKNAGISPELPDMIAAYDSGDLKKILAVAHEHQAAFESLLHENGVHPLKFSTLEEVESFLNNK
jgi:hypothetical protein